MKINLTDIEVKYLIALLRNQLSEEAEEILWKLGFRYPKAK